MRGHAREGSCGWLADRVRVRVCRLCNSAQRHVCVCVPRPWERPGGEGMNGISNTEMSISLFKYDVC